jgi:hypothetical protein
MSLLYKLNNRFITNHFLKGYRGDVGPSGPPGVIPYYIIKSKQSSTNKWNFDLSVIPSIIRTNNGLADDNISFGYQFIIAETATSFPPTISVPSCGIVNWIDAPNNTPIDDASLNDIGTSIQIDDKNISYLSNFQNYAMGNLLGKEVNISNDIYKQSIMYYCITDYSSDSVLKQTNNCSFTTTLNSFTTSSFKITKNAYTIFNIIIDTANGGIPTSTSKYLYLYLTPTFLFSTDNNIQYL